MRKEDLDRPVLIDLCKDGTISYRAKGQPAFNKAALPVFSVWDAETAQALQVHFGKLQYKSHPDMPRGTPWYKLFPWSGKVEDLDGVSDLFSEWYHNQKVK